MRLLLDTHVLLWAAAEPDRIHRRTREQIESGAYEVLYSAVSIWELAIKLQTGRLALTATPLEIAAAAVTMGFVELPVTSAHAAAAGGLPMLHRDPFDRLLVAQAVVEPARLLTVDRLLSGYTDLVDVIDE